MINGPVLIFIFSLVLESMWDIYGWLPTLLILARKHENTWPKGVLGHVEYRTVQGRS